MIFNAVDYRIIHFLDDISMESNKHKCFDGNYNADSNLKYLDQIYYSVSCWWKAGISDWMMNQ